MENIDYNDLAAFIQQFFGTGSGYKTTDDLQAQVKKLTDRTLSLRSILEHYIADRGLSISPKQLANKIGPSRWKLCQVCGRPFIATDPKNKTKVCKNVMYVRYYGNGVYANSSNKRSECYMERMRLRRKRSYHRNKVDN